MAEILFLRSGNSSFMTFQRISMSTSKYLWASLSLNPAIFGYSISGCLFLISSGMFFAASPMISKFLMTASLTSLLVLNFLKLRFSVYSSTFSIASSICLSGRLYMFLTYSTSPSM